MSLLSLAPILVAIFNVPAKYPRTSPEWPSRWDFKPVWPICCRFGLGGHFQRPGQVPRTPPEWPFNRISIQFGPFAADFALVAIFSHLARCPNKPSRMAFPMGFRPSLAHLLHIWPWWQFLASWPGAPESLQNCLSNGISAHFDSVAPYFALVGA